jgi:opacity protein-like surface antigen
MKLTPILLISLILVTTTQASDWQIGAGIYYADISGLNAYQASENTNNQDTENLTVPSFFIAKSFNNKFNLVYRYTSYDEIISNGVSSDTNVFNVPNVGALQSITEYRIKESLYESSFSFNYSFVDIERWKFEAGPTLSITKSKTDFFYITDHVDSQNNITENLRILRKISETDYTLGAEANVMYKISDKINFNVNYRYTSPSEKNIHLIGASISFNF